VSRRLVRGEVLVVVPDRDDCRAVFETLDGYEFDAIYTAKDFSEAHAFLAGAPRLDAVLLEFRGDAADAIGFCRTLRIAGVGAPVIGIARPEDLASRWRIEGEPESVVDWLRSPVIGQEAIHRLQRVLASGMHGALPAPAPARAAPMNVLGLAAEGCPDGILAWDPGTGLLIDANPAFCRRAGLRREDIAGLSLDGLDPGLGPVTRRDLQDLLARGGRVRLRPDGRDAGNGGIEVSTHMLHVGQRRVGLAYLRDVFDDRGQRAALHAAAAVAQRSAGGSGAVLEALAAWLDADGLWVVEGAERGGDGVTVVDRHGAAVLPAEFFPDILRRLRADASAGERAGVVAGVPGGSPGPVAGFEGVLAVPILDRGLGVVGALIACRRRAFEVPGLREVMAVAAARLGFDRDIERARADGSATALHDPLTGLPNRLLFEERLEAATEGARHSGEMFAVLFIDLDHFKRVNDGFGYGVGDEVLVAAAGRVRGVLRAADTLARYAGDAFTAILRHLTHRNDALRIAEQACRILELPITLRDGRDLRITASIGISFHPDDALPAGSMIRRADAAMSSAKDLGRNTFHAWGPGAQESPRQPLALEPGLRRAERNGELRVFYQPLVGSDSEDVVGVEALLRWEHPELGGLGPGAFLPLAEETGLIVPIGEWVLRRACADVQRWRQRFGLPLRVSVNLSASQLRQSNLADTVRDAVAASGLDPAALCLEVAERIGLPWPQDLMDLLRAAGASITIDEFGGVEGTLDHLLRLPVDRVKIDRGLVGNISVDPDAEAIVRATVEMARSAGLGVAAQGVEREEHHAFLRRLGCEHLQGFLYCRPLAAEDFERLLADRQRLLDVGDSRSVW